MTVEQVLVEIEKARSFISGITVSGGECTVQYDFLLALLKGAGKININAFIDTNGYIRVEQMKELSTYFDKAMLDIKSFDEKEHLFLTGKPLAPVIANAGYLLQNNKLHEIRTVIVPEKLDNKRNVENIARLIAGTNPQVTYKLIKFRQAGVKNETLTREPSDVFMGTLRKTAQLAGCLNVEVI